VSLKDRLEGLAQNLRQLGLEPIREEPMARHTSFRIGGPADLWVAVESGGRLVEVVQAASKVQAPVKVLGGGTNVLVSDRGIRGLVIANQYRLQDPEGSAEPPSGTYQVECGVPLARLAWWAVRKGLGGLEWAVGIPGSVGGAVLGNAGAFGGCMADVVQRVSVLDAKGQVHWLDKEDLSLGYRTSALKEADVRPVLLSAEVRLARHSTERLRALARQYQQRRRATQPRGASAGSVFRNPAVGPAGRLIEQAGLKGSRVGSAVVSEKHANYIINTGSATAEEVWALICQVQEKVWEQFGICLELEIELAGEWESWHTDCA